MSPLPGAPRGNAPPRGPHGTPPHQARHILAALLLAVLTLLGGAPGAALPVQGATPYAVLDPAHSSAPDAVVRAAPARWTDAVPAPGPRAGADRPHAPFHVPPPGHGALPPRTQCLPLPRGLAPVAAGTPFVDVRARAALPGVRGPPGAGAGHPARIRPCSTELSLPPH
ncbi:hypothetical protein ABT001_27845 [Streptomyces sp. NPDC002793]|uniref:hypothetical protein n=1 Tax=Streptomyces sp. NPDC002793 TaxID=3154432 RepID=UPI0033189871